MDLEDMQKQSVEVIQHLHHDAEQPQSSAEVGALGLSVYGANNCDVWRQWAQWRCRRLTGAATVSILSEPPVATHSQQHMVKIGPERLPLCFSCVVGTCPNAGCDTVVAGASRQPRGGGLGFHAVADCSQVSPGYTVKTSMSGSPGSLHILHFLGTAARQIPA